MEKPFRELRERLLRAGIAPRHVRRYMRELKDHLADLSVEEERAGHDRSVAEQKALARLGTSDDLARAMITQRQFRSWSARAPWAAFGLGPLLLLAACYLIACTILWTGWRIFLPTASTPFVGILDERAMIYFGVGRMLYFGAPIFVGWALATVAMRQRLSSGWPILAASLLAVFGAAAQVRAGRAADASQQVSMTFSFGASSPEMLSFLFHALVIATLEVLPYFVWRLASKRTGFLFRLMC